MKMNGFFDLNVVSNGKDIEYISKEWFKYKYRTIAINQVLDLSGEPSKKRKKGEKQEVVIPEPFNCSPSPELIGKINILNRLTVKVTDLSQLQKVFQGKSSPAKKYHIIAVETDDQSCFQQAISMNDVDILCLDCKSKPQWRVTRKHYKAALEQNKYFEICYSPTIKDSTTFNNTVFVSHLFYTLGKSKNMIVSSGTSETFYLRSPYEVIYLSLIFGFDENKARNCITTVPSSLIDRALKRQMGKSSFVIRAL